MTKLLFTFAIFFSMAAHASSHWAVTFRQTQGSAASQQLICTDDICKGTIKIFANDVEKELSVTATKDRNGVNLIFVDPTGETSYQWSIGNPYRISIGLNGQGRATVSLLDANLLRPNSFRDDLVHRQFPAAASLSVFVELSP